jgi:hypothetical protein
VNLPAAGSVFAFMSRTAPLMTLVAVGVLGGVLIGVNTMRAHEPTTAAPANTAQSATAPAAPQAAPPAGHEVDLAGVPVAGAKDEGGEAAGDKAGDAAGDKAGDKAAAPAPQEKASGVAGSANDLFAGQTADGALTVSIGVKGNKAAAVVADGKKAPSALAGTATARGLDLVDRTGKVALDGSMEDNTFTGTITVNGRKFDYTANGTTVAEAKADGREDVADVAKKVGL